MRPAEYRAEAKCVRAGVLLLLLFASGSASTAPLFENDTVLEIRLSGPLRAIFKNKRSSEREEHPFVLTVDGAEIPVAVRIRGNSRIIVCSFPPLRLNFSDQDTDEPIFAGQTKLKLVTHCKSNSERSENNVLDEYLAYRIFSLISDVGYRVRLLRITYDDTSGYLKHLDRSYYGFLIESNEALAARNGGQVSKIGGVPYSRLNNMQTALFFVFQYLIGNTDWSLIREPDDSACCHNADLMEFAGELYPIPYDFDYSGVVNASYAKPDSNLKIKRVTQRLYRGYCKPPIVVVAPALEHIKALQGPIMSIIENIPLAGDADAASRVRYIDYFFEEAENADKLLKRFDDVCIGPR